MRSIWADLGRLDATAIGESRYVEAEGLRLLVHRVREATEVDASRCYVTSSQCPHEDFTMDRCVLDGTTITCIEHGWKFDVRTGAVVAIGDEETHLPTYPVEVRDGHVYARLL